MKYIFWFHFGEQILERRQVHEHVANTQGDTATNLGRTALHEIQSPNFQISMFEQVPRQVTAGKASDAGDECSQGNLLLRVFVCANERPGGCPL